ncbi:UNVERIFIED_CONTAM: Anaphase-promoting complex subunit [Sesamum radiatum]|uniref:Anaphase-promoting complex subunit 5 n=1 Tax=Sesamum radiatum TaxID=300843 RepID=A0AAW2THY5_SESRA
MAAISKPPASFPITPHKLSICVLVQVYAPPSQISIPFPFSSVSHHNRLGVFLLSLTKACNGIFEPTLDELIAQSKEIAGLLNHWLSDHLTRRLSSLASPDDLFNFFADLRGILGGSDANVMDDDQIMLDPNSIIGMFIRRCLLAFNQMSFEVHYLRYLNSLYHDDYPGALENLHRYFDYRQPNIFVDQLCFRMIKSSKFFPPLVFNFWTEGVECVSPPSGCSSFGRYEIALLCLGMMHFHLGHPKQALEVLTEAVRVSQQCSSSSNKCTGICNLLCRFFKRSGNAVLGIPYALACISFCQSFNLDLLKASATLTLAELWLTLGSNHAKKALALLHGSFPVLLGHGGLELRSRAFITEAKCYLADPSFSVSDNPEMVLEPLRQASEDLQLLEYNELAAEAFYLMAIVYNKLGQLDEREEAASSFRKHITAFENPEDMDDSVYGTL